MTPQPATRPQSARLDTSAEEERSAEASIRAAVDRLGQSLPPDLARLNPDEWRRHVAWILDHGASGLPSQDDHGPALVLRRRIIQLLQVQVTRSWEDGSVPGDESLVALAFLARAHDACTPPPEQEFAAELADIGGLDLVVEVAHDMRSPLTSILFLSEILHRGQPNGLSEVQRRQVGIIYSAALSLVGMASDMIEVARGGNKLSGRSPSPFSVNELLGSVADLVSPAAQQSGVEVRLASLTAPHRLGYPIALSRVLLNLTTNALKFTHEGSVEISAAAGHGNTVEFAVQDTGPGIPPDELDSLFQPFKREPRRETGYAFSGTGLGLSICRRLVAAMGSRLDLTTEPGRGTRFSFSLDLPPASML